MPTRPFAAREASKFLEIGDAVSDPVLRIEGRAHPSHHQNASSEPILYLSLYFKRNRQQYYELLQRVRTEGVWESWLEFFLTGVLETAEQATDSAKSILKLFEKDRVKIEALGRPAGSALRLHLLLQQKPIVSVSMAAKKLKVAEPTVRSSLARLEKLGIVKEMTGGQRYRMFMYSKYLHILDEGTEPLRR